jgi:hypothetical protein
LKLKQRKPENQPPKRNYHLALKAQKQNWNLPSLH